jgi:hydroxysqualene dehydroxylase
MRRRLAVVGAGWAGLAAAVHGVQAGWDVSVFEMSPHLGGRARSLNDEAGALDNGQHILIGAYTQTLALMRELGVDTSTHLQRMPLALRFPDGSGLALPAGAPAWSLLRGIASFSGTSLGERVSLMRHALAWAARGFTCDEGLSVAALCTGLAPRVRQLLIDPLCVAAMNTHASEASASVFLRVLHDALLGGPGSADLLLPKRPLGELLPGPARRWLLAQGAALHTGVRVQTLAPQPQGWRVDDTHFDAVVLACAAPEAARLVQTLAPAWAAATEALRFEPIVTVYVQAPGARLPSAITALHEGAQAPAQFVFDHGQLGLHAHRFACVVSGAQRWVDLGLDATEQAVLAQLQEAFPVGTWPTPPQVLRSVAEKRATFRCTPGLRRPGFAIAPALVAAGDYVQGPYPATLEGAVRSAQRAVTSLQAARQP